jgi:hypothetical protein
MTYTIFIIIIIIIIINGDARKEGMQHTKASLEEYLQEKMGR